MSDKFYSITSNIWAFFGPPYLNTLILNIIQGRSSIQQLSTTSNLPNSQNMISLIFFRICDVISRRRQIQFSFYHKIVLSRKFPWNLQSICDITKRTKTGFVDSLFRFLMSQIDYCYQILFYWILNKNIRMKNVESLVLRKM